MDRDLNVRTVDAILLNISLNALLVGALFLRFYGSTASVPSFIAICLLFLAVLSVIGKVTLRGNPAFKLYFIFFIYCSASFFYGINTEFVYDVWLQMLSVVLFLFCVCNYCRTPSHFTKFCKYFVFFAALLGCLNIVMYTAGERDFELGGVNTVPIIMVVAIFICIHLQLNKVITLIKPSLYQAYIVIYVVTVLLSGSRKILLSIAAAILLYTVLQMIRGKFFKSIFKVISIIILLIVAGYYVSQSDTFKGSMDRFLLATEAGVEGDVQDVSGSTFRLFLIEKGIEYWKDSPVFGHGLNNYRALSINDTGLYTYSHNTTIELLSGLGAVGLILYIIFYVGVIRAIIKVKKYITPEMYNFLLSTCLCFIVVGNFQQTYWDVYMHAYFMLVVSYCIFIYNFSTMKQAPNLPDNT